MNEHQILTSNRVCSYKKKPINYVFNSTMLKKNHILDNKTNVNELEIKNYVEELDAFNNKIFNNKKMLNNLKESCLKKSVFSNIDIPKSWISKIDYKHTILKTLVNNESLVKYISSNYSYICENENWEDKNNKQIKLLNKNFNNSYNFNKLYHNNRLKVQRKLNKYKSKKNLTIKQIKEDRSQKTKKYSFNSKNTSLDNKFLFNKKCFVISTKPNIREQVCKNYMNQYTLTNNTDFNNANNICNLPFLNTDSCYTKFSTIRKTSSKSNSKRISKNPQLDYNTKNKQRDSFKKSSTSKNNKEEFILISNEYNNIVNKTNNLSNKELQQIKNKSSNSCLNFVTCNKNNTNCFIKSLSTKIKQLSDIGISNSNSKLVNKNNNYIEDNFNNNLTTPIYNNSKKILFDKNNNARECVNKNSAITNKINKLEDLIEIKKNKKFDGLSKIKNNIIKNKIYEYSSKKHFGPFTSYCNSCNIKNVSFFNNIEYNQACNILEYIHNYT